MEYIKDKKGINCLYINEEFLRENTEMMKFSKVSEEQKYDFYKIKDEDILLKIQKYYQNENEEDNIEKLCDIQKNVSLTDFPIGKVIYNSQYCGQIQKFYNNSVSLNTVTRDGFELFGKFYKKDNDEIYNLMIFFNELLDIIEELVKNKVYYFDFNFGNILIHNNSLKLIDFEEGNFKINDCTVEELQRVFIYYGAIVRSIIYNYGYEYTEYSYENSINDYRKTLVKLENDMRCYKDKNNK